MCAIPALDLRSALQLHPYVTVTAWQNRTNKSTDVSTIKTALARLCCFLALTLASHLSVLSLLLYLQDGKNNDYYILFKVLLWLNVSPQRMY